MVHFWWKKKKKKRDPDGLVVTRVNSTFVRGNELSYEITLPQSKNESLPESVQEVHSNISRLWNESEGTDTSSNTESTESNNQSNESSQSSTHFPSYIHLQQYTPSTILPQTQYNESYTVTLRTSNIDDRIIQCYDRWSSW